MGTLYENIIALCHERGIKGGKLCTDIGMSKGILTDLKMGRQTGISASNAQKIASYFGVSVGYLLGEEDAKQKLPTLQSEEQRFPDIYLTNSQQKLIFKILDDTCTQKQITHGEAIVRAKSSTNFFPRLQNTSLHQACSTDVLVVAEYLGVKETVENIIFRKPSLDNFSYAMHEEAEELSDESKALLLNLAKQLREKAHKNNGETK